MNPPVIMPLGRDALSWIQAGGKSSRGGWSQRTMLRWQAIWFERNRSLQHRLPQAPPLQTDPIFVLGLWRSGTTYLHDLLSACPNLHSPATWQCMSPATFRLRSPPAKDYPVQRPMDGLTINAFSPQEDEFALLALGIPSVYRGFFDPGRLPELTRWLDPDVWTNKPPAGWPAAWLEFLTGVMDGKAGRLVLKSPNHTFRLDTLIRLFPNAHYVWLVRDPIATFFSNRKMWLAMFERYALWPWNVSILDDFLTQTFMLAAECLGRASRILPRERLVVVQFDELTSATLDTLSRINHRLHIGNWDEIRPALLGPATAKAGYRHDTYNEGDLPASTRPAIERLRLTQSAALTSHGL